MKGLELSTLTRSTSSTSTTSTTKMLPSNFNTHNIRSSSSTFFPTTSSGIHNDISPETAIVQKHYSAALSDKTHSANRGSSVLHSLLTFLPLSFLLHGRKWFSNIISTTNNVLSVSPSLRRKLTGTIFGHRHGHVSFSVQLDPRSEPLMLLELDMSTTGLVKEMSSGFLRIALECEKVPGSDRARKLLQEPAWTMYCDGRKSGVAVSRTCGAYDRHVLNTIRSVSVGAGVIPVVDDGRIGGWSELGELVYMRANFERVVGSRDSEALFMINPDGNGGPELTIFMLRI